MGVKSIKFNSLLEDMLTEIPCKTGEAFLLEVLTIFNFESTAAARGKTVQKER